MRSEFGWHSPLPRGLQRLAVGTIVAVSLLSIGAVTQINLTTQVSGILPAANGGTNQNSTAVFPTSGTVMTTGTNVACGQLPALTGDTTSSAGACATTTVKVNGTSVPTNSAADLLLSTTAPATGAWTSIGSCSSAVNALTYNTGTHAFGCNTVGFNFADAETPSGTINGVNATFTLAHTPSPAASLNLFENGVQQRAGGTDYTLATATITYGTAPPTSSTLIAYYRY